jgi:hypothetical protein
MVILSHKGGERTEIGKKKERILSIIRLSKIVILQLDFIAEHK